MNELNVEEKQNVQNKESSNGITVESWIFLLFLGLLIIGVIGYFALRNLGINNVFAHIGGLGIVGLLGSLAGIIAKKKGYGYWKAFLFGLFLPILVGVIAVLLPQTFSCGGSPSLAAALLIIIIYSLIKRKNVNKQIVS